MFVSFLDIIFGCIHMIRKFIVKYGKITFQFCVLVLRCFIQQLLTLQLILHFGNVKFPLVVLIFETTLKHHYLLRVTFVLGSHTLKIVQLITQLCFFLIQLICQGGNRVFFLTDVALLSPEHIPHVPDQSTLGARLLHGRINAVDALQK